MLYPLLLISLFFIGSLEPSLDIIEATYGSFRNITKQVERSMRKHGKSDTLAVPAWSIKRLNREKSETQNVLDIVYVTDTNKLQRVLISGSDAYEAELSDEISLIEKDANDISSNSLKSYIVISDVPLVSQLLRARIGTGAWVDATDDIAGNVKNDSLDCFIDHDAYKEDLLAYEDEDEDEDDLDNADDEGESTFYSYIKQGITIIGKAISSFFNNNRMMVLYRYNNEYRVTQVQQGSTLHLPKGNQIKKIKISSKETDKKDSL